MHNNNRWQKLDGEDGKDENITKLCDLPDGIVQKILSDLPTKEAVATSVLSKSWVHKWTGINKIDLELLDEVAPEKRQQFIDFVEKLRVFCNTSSLKKFSLFFEVGMEAPRVTKWLSIFVNPNIEELKLELYTVKEPLVLSDQFFTSEKLTKFELSMSQVIKLPSTINFQNLVTLTLKHVIFPNYYCTTEFFLSLRSLKEMTLIDCNWKKVGTIIITCPLLQKLFIRDWKDHDDEDDHHDNEEEVEEELAEELNNDVNDITAVENLNYHHGLIRILSNELVSFTYDGDLMNDYSLFYTFSVSNATIKLHEQHNNMLHAGHFIYKLFIALSGVTKLSVSDFALQVHDLIFQIFIYSNNKYL